MSQPADTLSDLLAMLGTTMRSPAQKALAEQHRQEAAELVRQIAAPFGAGEQAQSQIMRAAQRLGFGYRRTRTLWYGDAKRIDSWEMDWMRMAKRKKRQRR